MKQNILCTILFHIHLKVLNLVFILIFPQPKFFLVPISFFLIQQFLFFRAVLMQPDHLIHDILIYKIILTYFHLFRGFLHAYKGIQHLWHNFLFPKNYKLWAYFFSELQNFNVILIHFSLLLEFLRFKGHHKAKPCFRSLKKK